MAIGSGVPYNEYTGNGVSTVYAFGFTLLDADDLVVTINGVVTSAYTVSGLGVAAGGSITFSAAPANGASVLLERSIALVRTTEYQNNGDLQAATVNDDFNRLWLAVQQSQSGLGGLTSALRVSSGGPLAELPATASRLDYMPCFDSLTGDAELTPFTVTQVASAVAAAYSGMGTADAATFIADGTGAASRTMQEKGRERISVKDFGATGDGVTNDTEAINLAFAACSAGKTVHFPAGDYLVGSAVASVPLDAIPVGVNVLMEKGAWLKGNGAWLTNFLTPSGRNILQVNIDGDSLPAGGVQDTWSAAAGSAVAISGTTATGHANNVEDVTIINSEFKNLQYGILTDGAKGWRVHNCYFHELRNCAALIGAQSGKESYRCVFTDNVFDNLGDYAVAFYSTNQASPGHNAFHVVANNSARNCQQITNGYAYGVEAGNPDYQHHITFANNVYQCTTVGLTGGNGGITISTTSDCVVIGNNLTGNLSDVGQAIGINAIGFGGEVARRGLITGNHLEGFSAAAISLHGHSTCLVSDNHIIDCGYTSSSLAPIRAGNLAASDVAIIDNFISISAGYAYYGAGTPAIGVQGADQSNFTIRGNIITNPNDVGILVVGTSGSPATNFTISGNQINGTQDATFFQREAIYVDYANDLTVTDNVVMDAHRGIVATNCDGGLLARNGFKGSETIATLYDITGSSGLNINDDIVTAPVTTAITPTARLAAAYTNYAKRCTSIVTEAYGSTGLISSGATVTHGMFSTPSQVSLTCTSAALAAGVTTKGATTFTITFGGGGTQNFDWVGVIR